MNLCSRFIRLSVPPLSGERPQMAMCEVECCGRLKCRATGLDASLSSFSTSRRCSRKQSPSRLPVSSIYSFLRKVQVMQLPATILSQPALTSYKRDRNISTFQCARARYKTCPFILNTDRISGPKRSIQITDRFSCTSSNVINFITCTFCKKLSIGETGRRLGDRFREHLRDVEKDDKDASKPVTRRL